VERFDRTGLHDADYGYKLAECNSFEIFFSSHVAGITPWRKSGVY
jgi:hypothetical protein